eukprot:1196063-Prorocentrum_minimum.AAC.3
MLRGVGLRGRAPGHHRPFDPAPPPPAPPKPPRPPLGSTPAAAPLVAVSSAPAPAATVVADNGPPRQCCASHKVSGVRARLHMCTRVRAPGVRAYTRYSGTPTYKRQVCVGISALGHISIYLLQLLTDTEGPVKKSSNVISCIPAGAIVAGTPRRAALAPAAAGTSLVRPIVARPIFGRSGSRRRRRRRRLRLPLPSLPRQFLPVAVAPAGEEAPHRRLHHDGGAGAEAAAAKVAAGGGGARVALGGSGGEAESEEAAPLEGAAPPRLQPQRSDDVQVLEVRIEMVHHLDNQANRRVPKQISAPLPPKRIRPPTARASRNLPGSLRESVRWVARRRSPPRVRRLEPGIRCRILLFGCVCIGRKPGSGPSRHTPPASRVQPLST